jgi:hypothetical protein
MCHRCNARRAVRTCGGGAGSRVFEVESKQRGLYRGGAGVDTNGFGSTRFVHADHAEGRGPSFVFSSFQI